MDLDDVVVTAPLVVEVGVEPAAATVVTGAVGVKEKRADSRIKALRAMGMKHKTVLEVGFDKPAVFKPGMIVGNAHTPRRLTLPTAVIPDALGWGNIRQEEVGRAFVAHLAMRVATQTDPVVSYGNREMKRLLAECRGPV